MRSIGIAVFMLCLIPSVGVAQNEPTDGLRTNVPTLQAFTNARIIVSPKRSIPRGTLVVRDGLIVDVGETVSIPADARVWDLSGMTIYPGFIELSSTYGMPKKKAGPAERDEDGPNDWNEKVRAHMRASTVFKEDATLASTLRSQGFVLAVTHQDDGIFMGTASLVSLGEGTTRELVQRDDVAQYVTLMRTGSFGSSYPGSLMGIIALIRQTFLDADWYARAHSLAAGAPASIHRPPTNHSLEALHDATLARQPVVIRSADEYDLLRASRIMQEFNLVGWIDGSGKEFRRIDAVRATKLPVVVPLNFPDKPSVASPEEALEVTLEELREWDAGPENPARLERAGVSLALTTRDLKKPSEFLAQLRLAVQRGLSKEGALRALTQTPAQLLNIAGTHGDLEKGKAASFIVADGDIFESATDIRYVWIQGKRHVVDALPDIDVRGTWSISVSGNDGTLTLGGEPLKLKGTMMLGGVERKLSNLEYGMGRVSFTASGDSTDGTAAPYLFSAQVTKELISGVWQSTAAGSTDYGKSVWTASRTSTHRDTASTKNGPSPAAASFPDVFPLGAFGRPSLPPQPAAVHIRNATIWTMGPQGRIDAADVVITKGKISSVGKDLKTPSGAVIIDGTGMHVTPGLFDAHSHTAISRGINEGGQSITCEVRIEDVLDPDDIWIYRQLAGGTIGANILHGSANPIGGQNAVVKWRWGALPDEILIDGAPQGVKFALGENVKRSNFRIPGQPVRYPASRMGVEQLIRDRFTAAREYRQAWQLWEDEERGLPPRRDLELDALVEMLDGKRLIHAHSYRQDEILMLLRVAEDFGIRVATFQHVLEGYKVAEALAQHGAGGSGFSDWWAYKWEAYDAIPGNLPLMQAQGVVVSYNSDNSQLATRLNWEAAKGLKYGMTEEEALATVTINPAKQLGIDRMTGSLEAGKDADVVLWNGNPLSTASKCLQTWIDGRKYFDVDEDLQMRQQIELERMTLIQKVLQESGGSSAPGSQRMMRRPNEDILESCTEETGHE